MYHIGYGLSQKMNTPLSTPPLVIKSVLKKSLGPLRYDKYLFFSHIAHRPH